MSRLAVFVRAAVLYPLGVLFLLLALTPPLWAGPVAIFGREELFTLNSGNVSALKASGFNTIILFVVDVESNGDLNYNGDHLIIQNGVWVGDTTWSNRLASLRQAPTTINCIEACTGGTCAQSWVNNKNLFAAQGTGPTSILYSNFMVLKKTLGIDAICNDDEVAYDSASAATFNNMITVLGMKNTLCPYNRVSYWQGVFNNSSVDAIYLQCYDGGAGNDPATWSGYFGGFKTAPGDWYNDSTATISSKFANWSPVINGGFIWQLEVIGDGNIAPYAAAIKRWVDPLMVTPSAGFTGIAAAKLRAVPASTTLTLSNASTASLAWSIINTSAWLTASTTVGTMAAGGTATVTMSLNTTAATNLAAGNYSATVIVSNRTTQVPVARTFTLDTAVANWPVLISGGNAAIMASNTATAAAPGATAFDPLSGYCFYQTGLSGTTRGLPLGGVFVSLCDGATAFQLGPYGGTNALVLGNTYPKSATLTLNSPDSFNSLAVLATSANGGGQGTFVVNFADGSHSPAFAYNCQDWFYVVTNVAIQGFGRLKLGTPLSAQDAGDTDPNLYQTTVNLAALGLTQPVSSITFSNPAGAGASQTTAILAVSGMSGSVPLSAPTGLAAIPGTNATVKLVWSPTPGATNYNVRMSTVSGTGYELIGAVNGTNFTATQLANGMAYYFVVSAVGAQFESANSAQVSALPGSYQAWSFGLNPVAYWPLNEASGTTAYELVAGNNGFYSGPVVFTTGGAVGAGFGAGHRAVYYNGSSSYAQIPRLIGGTNFSIVFWLKTSISGGGTNWYNGSGLVDGEVSGTTGDFGVALVGNKVGFGVGNPDSTLTSVTAVNNGQWHQVAVTRDAASGRMNICLDGKYDNGWIGPTGARTNSPALRIGGIQTGGGFFTGYIADVAMYNQALTTNQVALLYSAATGIFYDITLTNQIVGGNLRLSWLGNGKLLEATNLAGPWTTNVAASPVTVTPDQPQKFYRVRTQ